MFPKYEFLGQVSFLSSLRWNQTSICHVFVSQLNRLLSMLLVFFGWTWRLAWGLRRLGSTGDHVGQRALLFLALKGGCGGGYVLIEPLRLPHKNTPPNQDPCSTRRERKNSPIRHMALHRRARVLKTCRLARDESDHTRDHQRGGTAAKLGGGGNAI